MLTTSTTTPSTFAKTAVYARQAPLTSLKMELAAARWEKLHAGTSERRPQIPALFKSNSR